MICPLLFLLYADDTVLFFAAKTAIELEANVTLMSTVFLRGCKKINYF